MSAAEKLRALEERAGREPLGVDISDYSDEFCQGFLAGQETALSALPQIVAVVAAAEQAQRILPKSAGSVSEWNSIAHIEGALTATLAALDEVLTADGKESAGELRDEGIHDAFDANQWD